MRRFEYYAVTGSEWTHLFNALMGNSIKLANDSEYNEMMFYLACSIIEDDPEKFWTRQRSDSKLV